MAEVKFLHLNVHHSLHSHDGLKVLLSERELDVVSLNEPLVRERETGAPRGYAEVSSGEESFRAAFWVSDRIPFVAILLNADTVAIRANINREEVLVVTCYCPPAQNVDNLEPTLEVLRSLLERFPTGPVILMGDFNAKSSIWGPGPTNARGRSVISFASNANLEVINDPDSPPT